MSNIWCRSRTHSNVIEIFGNIYKREWRKTCDISNDDINSLYIASTSPHKHVASAHISPNKNPELYIYWYSTYACNLFQTKRYFHPSVHYFPVQQIKLFSKYLESLDGWYNCVEFSEEKKSNIYEYDISIMKAKICSLKHSYESEILYLGFGNVKLNTRTDCCDEAATNLHSKF